MSPEKYLNDIDSLRTRRALELSEVKRLFSANVASTDPLGVNSKALIVLCYAAWEGFYNDCVDVYFQFLRENGHMISSVNWKLLIGVLDADFDSLRSRNHSFNAKTDFICKIAEKMKVDFSQFERSALKAQSNLNWEKLERNFKVLEFDLNRFQKSRNKIQHELVQWRHQIAHGDSPELSSFDAENHVDFVQDILVSLSDIFQESIVHLNERYGAKQEHSPTG